MTFTYISSNWQSNQAIELTMFTMFSCFNVTSPIRLCCSRNWYFNMCRTSGHVLLLLRPSNYQALYKRLATIVTIFVSKKQIFDQVISPIRCGSFKYGIISTCGFIHNKAMWWSSYLLITQSIDKLLFLWIPIHPSTRIFQGFLVQQQQDRELFKSSLFEEFVVSSTELHLYVCYLFICYIVLCAIVIFYFVLSLIELPSFQPNFNYYLSKECSFSTI